jgi:formiminotetrahydrofolate cyclodeaminase
LPQRALNECAGHCLRLENFSESQVLENRLEATLESGPRLDEFISSVASPEPVPGGGSVAAHAASLAAALGEMVAGLTEGRKKFESVDARVREVHRRLTEIRIALQELAQEDAAAYREVMSAYRLPKDSDEQMAARSEAVQMATRKATEAPLRTARLAAEILGRLEDLVAAGNPNARSDAATGGQLAFAALKGAQYNVLINVSSLEDARFADLCRNEVNELAHNGQIVLLRIDSRMQA